MFNVHCCLCIGHWNEFLCCKLKNHLLKAYVKLGSNRHRCSSFIRLENGKSLTYVTDVTMIKIIFEQQTGRIGRLMLYYYVYYYRDMC